MNEGATVAWFHCFSGIADDMALGALIDAGADLDEVRALCERLPLGGWDLDVEPVLRGGIAATRVHIRAEHTSVVRTVAHISAMIDEARLPERVRARSQAAFAALADADARAYGRAADTAHFHEVGSLGTIIDVVGTAAALEVLDVDAVHASAIALGQGMARSAHGLLPVPRPATVELLRHAPTYGLDVPQELTTPTGAAIVASSVAGWGSMPPMVISASGFGAGRDDLVDRPNVVQVVLGNEGAELAPGQPVTLLEANLDDATGETLAHTVGALLDAGAHDAWITPIILGKGRPAHTVSALVDTALARQVADALAAETGAMGIRGQRLERWPRPRSVEEVDIAGRRVRVKVSAGRVKVEHDDAARAARHIGIPVREVVSLAEEAWRRQTTDLDTVRPLQPAGDGDDDEPDGTGPSIA